MPASPTAQRRRAGTQVLVASTVRLGAGTPALLALRMAAATTPDQCVRDEAWTINGAPITAEPGDERLARVETTGAPAEITYTATVDLDERDDDGPLTFAELVRWTAPSRYCPCDLTGGIAGAEFPDLDAAGAIGAVARWVSNRITYQWGTSTTATTALETLGTGMGVCRDFAHLGVCLLRSLGVPARYVAAYVPHLDPPDYHALVEAHDGRRWRLVDPTGLSDPFAAVRIATGADGSEAPFLTILRGAAPVESLQVAAAIP